MSELRFSPPWRWGGALLGILQQYYQGQKIAYLRRNATAIGNAVSPYLEKDTAGSPQMGDLKNHLALLAFLSQARVRLLDPQGKEIVNYRFIGAQDPQVVLSAISLPSTSGVPANYDFASRFPRSASNAPAGEVIRPSTGVKNGPLGILLFLNMSETRPVETRPAASGTVRTVPGSENGPTAGQAQKDGSVSGTNSFLAEITAVETLYGFDLQGNPAARLPRSPLAYRQNVLASVGTLLGSVELSDGPSVGKDIVALVAVVWGFASRLAVIIAALAGWRFSRWMSVPILSLTAATGRMSQGDLAVRIALHRQDELGALARSFNEMDSRTAEMVTALRRFIGDAAHELNTPLTTLRASLELAGSKPGLPEVAHGYIQQAREETRRMEALSRDLLDLSLLEADQLAIPDETIDVREILRETSERYASQAEQRGIRFELDITDQAAPVLGHPIRLQRVIGNLLENALKLTPTGGQICVSLFRDNLEAVIQIVDSGIGIPDGDSPFVFNRFHRGRNATSYPGSGLGLAIVKAIIDQHGGNVSLMNQPVGTKVELRLPYKGCCP
jgi:signal transduction histidine kinase